MIEEARLEIIAKMTEKLGQNPTKDEVLKILNKYFTKLEGNEITDISDTSIKLKTKEGGHELLLSEVIDGVTIETDVADSASDDFEDDLTERVGDYEYIKYEVSYQDMYLGYNFKPGNGWRLLTKLTDAEKEAKLYRGDIKIISTGIPAKLQFYGSDDSYIGSWWGTKEQVTALFGETIANKGPKNSEGGYPSHFAVAGLIENFKDIVFSSESNPTKDGGVYSNINGKTSGNITGADFLVGKYVNASIHNLTLEELNEARGLNSNDRSTVTTKDGGTGLFYLWDLDGYEYVKVPNYRFIEYVYWLSDAYNSSNHTNVRIC